jgi:NADH:ubiquinone oxidoreductase subunit 5 (subunit L)/multisubunit Na+/H+ antiporter MnhA subunit
MTLHTLDFGTINTLVTYCPEEILELVSFLLFIGAVGKSAQVGLHT